MAAPTEISRARLESFEVLVPYTFRTTTAPMVSNVRSTLVTASLLAIRENGWEQRYFAALPTPTHAEIRNLVAGSWIPVGLAFAHYSALDNLGLSARDICRVAEDVSQRTQKSFAAVLAKASTEVGATPWLLFSKTPSIWERIFVGGDINVYRAGPKEAYLEPVQCPLLRTTYFRTALVAYFRAFVLLLSKTVYSTEITKLATPTSVVFRCSWV